MKENIPLQPGEEIVPIQGYEGLYLITSHGRVWSHKRKVKGGNNYREIGGRFLKLKFNKRIGYLQVTIFRGSKRKMYSVHILVAIHYILNSQNLPEVNHKDGNKLNNFAGTKENNYTDGNLEWCTHDNNMNHAMKEGLLLRKRISEYHGIYFNIGFSNKKKPWIAQTTRVGRRVHIGCFKTEIEAAKAYNKFILKYNMNKPLNLIKR